MRSLTFLLVPALLLIVGMNQTVEAQNPIDSGHPVVTSLASDPGMAQVFLDAGIITVVADPTLPSGVGVSVDCAAALDAINEMEQMIIDARDDYLWEHQYYDEECQNMAETGEWDQDWLDQCLKDLNEARDYWHLLEAAFRPAIAMLHSLRGAAGCP
ncbi:MAG: hypothetical protein AAF517_13625 [Planctomycetota bacterium]